MGCHEGLGMGFYEALASGTPVITINNPPNNEIIKENINGWCIDYTPYELSDNNCGIVNRCIFNEDELKNKILHIDKTYNKQKMYDSVVSSNVNNDYIENLIKYL
jgi:glycosyltransferase involved in cell wall biosynthesis